MTLTTINCTLVFRMWKGHRARGALFGLMTPKQVN